jgi:hypothetical protein
MRSQRAAVILAALAPLACRGPKEPAPADAAAVAPAIAGQGATSTPTAPPTPPGERVAPAPQGEAAALAPSPAVPPQAAAPKAAAPTPAPTIAGATGTVAPAPGAPGAPTTAPPPAPVRACVAVTGSAREPLAPGGQYVVDPASSFELELAAAVPDARLELLDASEALVPSRGARELGATTRLTLAPAEPLQPSARYVLRVYGAASRELHSADGTAYAPVALAVIAAGDPPPAPPPKPKRRHRR